MMDMIQVICNYFFKMIRVFRLKGGYIFWIEMLEIVDIFQLYEDVLCYNIVIVLGSMFFLFGGYCNCF